MKLTLLRPFGAIVVLLCCLPGSAPVAAQEAQKTGTFRVLKLGGHQVRWAPPAGGGARVITYGLATRTESFPAARNCRGLAPLSGLAAVSGLTEATIAAEARAAFDMWEAAADILFKPAPEGTQADILIGAQVQPVGWAFADVFFDTAAPEAVKPISKALVCLNPTKRWKVGFDGNLESYDLRYTLAHEIGHAIGLDHPASADEVMNFRYEERFRALQPGDIHGAVALYGAPPQRGVIVAADSPDGDPTTASASGPTGGRALGK